MLFLEIALEMLGSQRILLKSYVAYHILRDVFEDFYLSRTLELHIMLCEKIFLLSFGIFRRIKLCGEL